VPRLDRPQILRFLHALDAALVGNVEVVVVGGLAAIVQYNAAVKTSDMDVYEMVSGRQADLYRAADVAADVTGVVLAISPTTVTDLPWNFEDRLKRVRGLRLKRLTMIVPDKYDLALSKMVRGYEHDLEAIASMHESHPLAEKTLVTRFEKDIWKIAVGDPRNFALNMIHLVRLLYGEQRAAVYRERWGLDKPR
jgi:hypothetical protein